MIRYTTKQGFKYTKLGFRDYKADMDWTYYSERYGKAVRITQGQHRDGATGARDIVSLAWWIHDQLCADGHWLDGTDVTPWQAACVLGDILRSEGRWARATYWKYATLVLGCKKAHGDHGHAK